LDSSEKLDFLGEGERLPYLQNQEVISERFINFRISYCNIANLVIHLSNLQNENIYVLIKEIFWKCLESRSYGKVRFAGFPGKIGYHRILPFKSSSNHITTHDLLEKLDSSEKLDFLGEGERLPYLQNQEVISERFINFRISYCSIAIANLVIHLSNLLNENIYVLIKRNLLEMSRITILWKSSICRISRKNWISQNTAL